MVGSILTEIGGPSDLPVERLTHELIRRLISVFVADMLASSANLAEMEVASADDIRTAGRAIIAFSPAMAADLETIRIFCSRTCGGTTRSIA